MIRQAHTYLVGALSGVTLIAIAIGAFIVLASAQVFHEWPIANLSSQQQKAAVAAAKALPEGGQTAVAGTAGTSAAGAHQHTAKAGAHATTRRSRSAANHQAGQSGELATGPGAIVATAPITGSGGDHSAGGNSGSHSSQPSTSSSNSSSSTTSSNPSSSSGGSSGSPSSPSGTGTSTPSGGSSGSTGSGGSGSGSGGTATGPVTAVTKPAQVITETINETVSGVDETLLGGTLEETGVSQVTEEVVTGVAGPESVVPQTVEGAGEAVSGLLGGGQ